MSIFFIFILFIFGLFIGSFLNVLIDRLPQGKSILGRSKCDHCHKTLSWKDLIPLVSFIYLKGKCRYCRASLSYQYPLLEIFTGLMFALTYLLIFNFQISNFNFLIFNLIFSLVFVSSLIVIFFADLKYGIIPDETLAVIVLITVPYLFINHQSLILNHFISALGAFLFFLLIFTLTRGRGMGFGDVKLAGALGLLLGFPGVGLAIYIAFLTGGLTGIILILWKKKMLKSEVAFGPFLVIGAYLSFFFSPIILPKVMALLS